MGRIMGFVLAVVIAVGLVALSARILPRRSSA
jgi:hypothetical protein